MNALRPGDGPAATPIQLWLRRTPRISRDAAVPPVATTPEVAQMLAAGAVVACGVSGGKDGAAAAIATARHLDAIGHKGPRLLIHSDLGEVEWKDSLSACERLAQHLGWELLVVRRAAGDMLARWNTRWTNNVMRYQDLSCVKLILPWSTPSMRFCTSELKTQVLTSALKKRFPGQRIVSVAGIRREESAARSKMPVSITCTKLSQRGAAGVNWHPIIDYQLADVLTIIGSEGLDLHEAYTRWGMSRVSCAFCIMSSIADLLAASSCPDNFDLLRKMVGLEVRSTFAFQGDRWLGDVAPHVLGEDLQLQIAQAKERAAVRQLLEAQVPKHLLYTKGWPTVMPTMQEAQLLAHIRTGVAAAVGLTGMRYTTAEGIHARYAELMAQAKTRDTSATGDEAAAPGEPRHVQAALDFETVAA